LVLEDTGITLEFFGTQFRQYMVKGREAIVCKLMFVLQSIRDYHVPAEYAFETISTATMIGIQSRYTSMLLGVNLWLTGSPLYQANPSICNPQREGRQFSGDSVDDAGNYSDDETLLQVDEDFQAESQLGSAITNWVQYYVKGSRPQAEISPSQRLYARKSRPPGGRRFKSYRIMKVFILEHTMSLGSRGKRSRDEWRLASAKSMTKLNPDRFVVCEAIILSLFLRRLNALKVVDNEDERQDLNRIPQLDLWSSSVNSERQLVHHLTTIFDPKMCGPRVYLEPYQFLSTRSLYNRVSINFKIFVNDTLAYMAHCYQIGGRNGQPYAEWIERLAIKISEQL
jgi:hypothetical protein